MTGFGRAETIADDLSVVVEIRTLNNRYLDIAVRLPHSYNFLEDRIKKEVASHLFRGRVEVTIQINNGVDTIQDFEVNIPLAKAYMRALSELRNALNIRDEFRLETFLTIKDIINPVKREEDSELVWERLCPCLQEALQKVHKMRICEGEVLYQDIIKRINRIEEGLNRIQEMASSLIVQYQTRLKERVLALTQGTVELDPNRIAQEAAFLAERSDITEEVTRIRSHTEQFRKIIDSEGPVGRQLNFLLQELNREFNTIGTKAGGAMISQEVVLMKSELEKMREQVQNVE